MASTKYIRIQTKGDTEANWLNSSIVPLAREMVYATDTRKIKFGDGEHLWRDLPTYEGSAYTLDENNNANFAGTVSSNLKELATKEYVDSKIADGGSSGDQSEKTVTATYSGTADSDAVYGKIWTSYTAMVKVAEAPKGIKSIKNASISGVRRNNSNLNFTIAVEDSMIDSSNSGLILINYQHLQVERNPIARAAIVTIAGTYNNFAMDGTTDIDIVFTEPGIYLLDNSGYSGQDYTSNFTFTAVCDENGTESASPIDYTGHEIQMFNSIICIGDSVTEGTFDIDTAKTPYKTYSYPTNLKKMIGAVVTNAGITGVTSTQWYQAALDSTTYSGHWDQYNEWNRASSYKTTINLKGYDAAIIHLGINDVFAVSDSNPIATVANNFETAINNIITKLREQTNNGIKIFLCTLIPNYVSGSNWEAINEKIRNIVANDTQVYLIDLTKYSKILNDTAYEVDHPTKTGYNELAKEIYALVSYTISQNLSDFNTISTNIINNRQTGADYATKNYVDSKIGNNSNDNIIEGSITLNGTPTLDYVDLFTVESTNEQHIGINQLAFDFYITPEGNDIYSIPIIGTLNGLNGLMGLRNPSQDSKVYCFRKENAEGDISKVIVQMAKSYFNSNMTKLNIKVEVLANKDITTVTIPSAIQDSWETGDFGRGLIPCIQEQFIQQSNIQNYLDTHIVTLEGITTDGTTSVSLKGNKNAITDPIAKQFLNSDNRLTVPSGTVCDAEITVFCAQPSTSTNYKIGAYTTAFYLKTSGISSNAIHSFANHRTDNNEYIDFIPIGHTDISSTTIKANFKRTIPYNSIEVTGLADTTMKWKAFVKISNIFTPEFE